MIKLYYGPPNNLSDSYRLQPAPLINISTEMNYANDTIIGYVYKISLDGYVTSYKKPDDENSSNNDFNIRTLNKILGHIDQMRGLLSSNGNSLTVVDDNGSSVLVANGGVLKSLNFEDTDNKWVSYAKFSAEIEFNELNILGENFNCGNSFIDSGSRPSNDFININDFKIKEFSDGWTFNIEDSAFNFVKFTDNNSQINLNNSTINVSYNISATGYDYISSDGSTPKVSPGWLQAKNFAQKRLYDQVTQIDQILKLSGDTACDGIDSLSSINSYGDGAYKDLSSKYDLYNETIDCTASESNGSFSLTYNAILKIKANSSQYNDDNVIHTVTKEFSYNSPRGERSVTNISVTGTITGLIPGGLIGTGGTFSLPSNGSILISSGNNSVKFNNANAFISKIIDNNDLKSNFKTVLDITYANLESQDDCNISSTIKARSFNLTKNFMEGTISYKASYNNDCVKDDGEKTVTNTEISIEFPEAKYAELILPNNGYVIQFLNTFSSKKVNVSVNGRYERNCCFDSDNFSLPDFDSVLPPPLSSEVILQSKSINYNPLDGSYRISATYLCGVACNI